ncbi:hypothetical protein SPRA44_120015 [Serratia proteamaculans]|nr:hypothetical protein SPRA44_120015 [Serratia proteamaculans]
MKYDGDCNLCFSGTYHGQSTRWQAIIALAENMERLLLVFKADADLKQGPRND